MKKIFVIVCALMFAVSSYAQVDKTTVEYSKPFENVYVNIDLGAQSSMQFKNDNWNKSILPVVGLELGKDLTPVVGLSVEGFAALNSDFSSINNTNVVGNIKFNLMNLFAGYKDAPRTFEMLIIPGVGWGHDFMEPAVGEDGLYITPYSKNYATFNTFTQFNFNLGKQKAWMITMKPGVVWNQYNYVGTNFNPDFSKLQCTFGVTYKFGMRRTNSHNFIRSPYSVTKVDYDAALAEIAALKNREPEFREIIKEVMKEVYQEKEVVVPGEIYITFDINKATVTAVENAKILNFVKQLPTDTKVMVIGSADTKTGRQVYNEELAVKRANAVVRALVNAGVKEENISTTSTLDVNENVEASRSAVVKVIY